MIFYRPLKKLYKGRYQYKIVLVSSGVSLFRSGDLDKIFKNLSEIVIEPKLDDKFYTYTLVKSQEDLDYLFDVYQALLSINDFSIRVESPWLSIYFSSEADVNTLKNINEARVKYIYQPSAILSEGEIVSTLPFDYKVHFKNTASKQESFLLWATDNKNIRLPKSTINALSHAIKYPPSLYFYITGDKNLTMAKMHLGSIITRVEKIVRPAA
jgi:hypothetical protein